MNLTEMQLAFDERCEREDQLLEAEAMEQARDEAEREGWRS